MSLSAVLNPSSSPIPKKLWMLWMSPSALKEVSNTTVEDYMSRDQCKEYLKDRIIKQVSTDTEKSQWIVDKCMNRICMLAEKTNWECHVITKKGHVNKFLEEVRQHNALGETAVTWISKVLFADGVGMAHKSDLIRLVLLYMHGGVWMDASTVPIDTFDWILELKAELVLPYVSPDQVIQWLLQKISKQYDEAKFEEFQTFLDTEFSKNIIWGRLAQIQPFVPENYFIACQPGNPVIRNVVDELNSMWGRILTKEGISSEEVNKGIRKYMMDIVYARSKLFKYKEYEPVVECEEEGIARPPLPSSVSGLTSTPSMLTPSNNTLLTTSVTGGKKQKQKRRIHGGEMCRIRNIMQSMSKDSQEMLKEMWGDGYLFNYIQIYYAILRTYPDCCVNMEQSFRSAKETVRELPASLSPEANTAITGRISKYYEPICQKRYQTPDQPLFQERDKCNDYAYTENDVRKIYFVSASFIRLFKWADTLDERLTLKNTMYADMLSQENLSAKEIIQYLRQNNQHFVKLGSWTRVPSYDMVVKIFKLLEKNDMDTLSGGKRRLSYKKRTVSDLKKLCKERKLIGYSSMTKDELIALLQKRTTIKTKSKSK